MWEQRRRAWALPPSGSGWGERPGSRQPGARRGAGGSGVVGSWRGPQPAAGGWQTHAEITTAWLIAGRRGWGVRTARRRVGRHVRSSWTENLGGRWARAPRGRPCAQEQPAESPGEAWPPGRIEVLKRWPGDPQGPGFIPAGEAALDDARHPWKRRAAPRRGWARPRGGTGAVLSGGFGPLRLRPPSACPLRTTRSCLGGQPGVGVAGKPRHPAPTPSQFPREPGSSLRGPSSRESSGSSARRPGSRESSGSSAWGPGSRENPALRRGVPALARAPVLRCGVWQLRRPGQGLLALFLSEDVAGQRKGVGRALA